MEVICIRDDWNFAPFPNIKGRFICPVKDQVYTVTGTFGDAYALSEIPVYQDPYFAYWNMSCFVPVDAYKKEELEEELNNIFQKIPV